MTQDCRFNTSILHGKVSRGYAQRELLPPVSQVTSFQYENMEALENVFAHRAPGFAYTRIGNPTIAAFEQILGCKTILMGFGLEQNAIHSPNESMDLEVWEKGIVAVSEFYKSFASNY